jgi:uncharacterized phage infection (PIP) family protein YhgE
MSNLQKLSDIELSQELKTLARKAKQLRSSIPQDLLTPEQIVEKVRIEEELAEITEKQTAIGTLLLEREEERQKRKVEKLAASSAEGAAKVDQLLERLPEFAEKVSVAFKVLGEEYFELLLLSKEIRQINSVLLHANLPQCGSASLKIEPNHLFRLLKQQFRECFGADAADVFLPEKTVGFDIIEAVADIRRSVTVS